MSVVAVRCRWSLRIGIIEGDLDCIGGERRDGIAGRNADAQNVLLSRVESVLRKNLGQFIAGLRADEGELRAIGVLDVGWAGLRGAVVVEDSRHAAVGRAGECPACDGGGDICRCGRFESAVDGGQKIAQGRGCKGHRPEQNGGADVSIDNHRNIPAKDTLAEQIALELPEFDTGVEMMKYSNVGLSI